MRHKSFKIKRFQLGWSSYRTAFHNCIGTRQGTLSFQNNVNKKSNSSKCLVRIQNRNNSKVKEEKRKKKEKKGKCPIATDFTAVKNKAELEDLPDAGETSNLMCHLFSRIFRRYRQNFQFKVAVNFAQLTENLQSCFTCFFLVCLV